MSFVLSLLTGLTAPDAGEPVRRAMAMLRRDMAAVLTEHVQKNEIVLCGDASLPAEAWRMRVTPERLQIDFADELGAIYALLHISQSALGIEPCWFWNDQRPVRRKSVQLPCGEKVSRPFAVRYRGWFINDEVLLHTWSLCGSRDKPWEMAFETLLRLGGNMVIPGTDRNAHRYRGLAASFGLYVTHHHAEPLGATMFLRAYPELTPSYAEHPALYEKLWADAIARQRGQKVVYGLGFRGQGDKPFWEDDPACDTPEKRGARISGIVRKQYDMVQAAAPGAPCCISLYGEVMELYNSGLIELPDEIIRVWSDNGFGRMVTRRQNNHNPRIPALPRAGESAAHGVYYHASFYDLQAAAQMTMLPNPPAFVRRELTGAMALGVRDFWLVNCSNVKPHLYTLSLIAALWRDGDVESARHLAEYCARTYGQENAAAVAACFDSFYAHPLFYGEHEDDRAGEQFGNHVARMLVSQWMRNPQEAEPDLRWATDAPALREQVCWYREKCEEAVRGYGAHLHDCEGVLPGLSEPGKTLFEDSLLMQARLLERTYKGALFAMQSLLRAMERDWLEAFYLAGKSRVSYLAADRAMREREHGKWHLFYANDCLVDVKQSAWLMGVLMGVLRNAGDGPHFYQWQRRFMDPPEDASIMLILNMENHLDNDGLFALMRARME